MTEMERIVADVLTDYADEVCDDLDQCACSMARLHRLMSGDG